MSPFKGFKIWSGWFAERYPSLNVIFCFISFAVALVSLYFITGFIKPTLFSLNPVVGIVIIVVGSILFILTLVGLVNATSDNWRVAIRRAREFAEENYLFDKGYLLRLTEVIKDTEQTEDPVELNKWIENYKEQEKITKDLEKLREEQAQIPQKIKEKEEQRRILRDKLFK